MTHLQHMTSPHVVELPRRLEAITRDTFLGSVQTSPHNVNTDPKEGP
jgi:hypothetical protein